MESIQKKTRKFNILITGGAGYIGSHTVYELNKFGYNCIILDNFIEGNRESVKNHMVYDCDLKNIDDIRKIFQENKIDAVIHFAAYAYIAESIKEPYKYFQNNVVNTIKLLDIMQEFNVKKIVFSSSCASYGRANYTPIDENHPQNPINPYGATKLMVEEILKQYDEKYGIKSISSRYFNACGANIEAGIGECHKNETHIIPLILKTLIGEREKFTIFGTNYDTPDGTCIRDYIHVCDLATAHRLALEKLIDEPKSHCINLGTGCGTSIKELIYIVEKITGKKVPISQGSRREGDPAILFCSCKKAKEILNWQPKRDISEIIKTAWLWEQRLYSKTQ